MPKRSSNAVDSSLADLNGYLMSLQTALATLAQRNTSNQEMIEQLQSVTGKASDVVDRLRYKEEKDRL